MTGASLIRCRLERLNGLGCRQDVAWSMRVSRTPDGWVTEAEASRTPLRHQARDWEPLTSLLADTEEPWLLERGTVHWEGGPGATMQRDYLLVELREHWRLLAAPGTSMAPLRTASATPTPDDRIILGPSAVLQLLDHLLSSDAYAGGRFHETLDVFEAWGSPYPPQALPPWLLPAELRDREFVREGRRAPRQADEHWYPRPRLPGEQGAPIGVSSGWEGLRVACSRPTRLAAGVMVESLVPLTWRCDEGAWEARLALAGRDGSYALVPGRSLLRIDPHALLLDGLDGWFHPVVPTLLRDPIRADRHGMAPALATTLVLGECQETG